MTFKEWLKTTNLSVAAFARLMEIDRNTIFRMLKGFAPSKQTQIKLFARTKKMKVPLTYRLMKKMFDLPEKTVVVTCCCEDCV